MIKWNSLALTGEPKSKIPLKYQWILKSVDDKPVNKDWLIYVNKFDLGIKFSNRRDYIKETYKCQLNLQDFFNQYPNINGYTLYGAIFNSVCIIVITKQLIDLDPVLIKLATGCNVESWSFQQWFKDSDLKLDF